MKIFNIVLVSIIVLVINNCGGSKNSSGTTALPSPSPSPSPSSSPSPSPTPPVVDKILHNGTNYKTVVSPNTGRIWLDRNLGAARVCRSYNDTACYGDYYQCGRNFDGHQDSTSSLTTKQASNINDAGSDFILDNGEYRNDWANEDDKNGDKRMKLISSFDGSFVCPKDFRIPTTGEFLIETIQASIAVTNNIEAYESFLKFPSSGLRLGGTGKMRIDDTDAFYTVKGGNYESGTDYFYYSNDSIGKGQLGARVNGASIRCIKN